MSMYNERYDEALSKTSWVTKVADNGRTYLFKYASHPESQGYLFVATDLETVHFEALTAASIPMRIRQVAEADGDDEEAERFDALGYDEQQRMAGESLVFLGEAFDSGWSNGEIQAESDDYFDAVFALKAGGFSWRFNLTELRGRQPLAFISKHLLTPFVTLMGQDRGVEIPTSSSRPVDAVSAVVCDPGVARALRRVIGAPPSASARATPAPVRRSRPPATPPPPASSAATVVAAPRPKSPVPVVRSTTPQPREEERTPRPLTPERAPASQMKPLIPPSSPTPMARKRSYNFLAIPSSEMPSSEPTTVPLTSQFDARPPAPAWGTDLDQGREGSSSACSEPIRSSPPLPPVSSSSAAEQPSSTQDPLLNTLPNKKKKKEKKMTEAEEEAEADRRREAMKRKMAKGVGGSKLGRKR